MNNQDVYTIQIETPDDKLIDLNCEYMRVADAESKAFRIHRVSEAEGLYGTVIRVFENGRRYAEYRVE